MSSLTKLFEDSVTVKVSISVEDESIFLGQPTDLRLCIEKVEGDDVEVFHGCDTRNFLGRSMSFTIRAKDPKGEFVPDPYPVICNRGGKGCFRRVEPFKASLFLTHYVKFLIPGTHKIFCKKNFKFRKMGTVEHKEIEVMTTLQVNKIDTEKFTEVVEGWIVSCGRNLERIHTDEGERLVKKLRYTEHNSVTDFFVKVLKMKNTENLYTACDYLSKGGTDRGFKALVEVMKNLRVEDIRGYNNMQAALNRLGNYQYSIIQTIGRCSHPASLTEVLKAADNPHESVRRAVCQKCGSKIQNKYKLRCYFQLRKYLKDEHDSVKRSAMLYLKNHPIDEYQNALILSVKRKEISDIVIVTNF